MVSGGALLAGGLSNIRPGYTNMWKPNTWIPVDTIVLSVTSFVQHKNH